MFNVIEFSESVREYGRIEDYSEVKKFDSIEDIFKKYIDIEWWKSFSCKDEIGIDDVLNMKGDIGVMSVNEDMSLYIFKVEDLVYLLEDYVFELGMRVKGVSDEQ